MKETKQEIADTQVALEDSKTNLENLQTKLSKQKSDLQILSDAKEKEMEEYNNLIAAGKKSKDNIDDEISNQKQVIQEMEALKEMLYAATKALKPGGRLVVITYHSLEDRMVKNIMKTGNIEGKAEQDFFGNVQTPFKLVNNKVIVAGNEEVTRNPRSRSAKLRIAEKR